MQAHSHILAIFKFKKLKLNSRVEGPKSDHIHNNKIDNLVESEKVADRQTDKHTHKFI